MINIKATNMELTDAITDYVNARIEKIQSFAKNKELSGYAEVGKTTHHHKQGEHYKAEFSIIVDGTKFFACVETEDLYTSIEDAKDEIVRQITHTKDRKQTLYKRGAASVKKMIKGISDRNPFTSK
jgi:ribosomal subunit interface protein